MHRTYAVPIHVYYNVTDKESNSAYATPQALATKHWLSEPGCSIAGSQI